MAIRILSRWDSSVVILTVEAETLQSADLQGANLYGANLGGADLQGADLQGADLQGADLYGADLQGANLRGANLGGANLRSANLRSADLYGADLRGADLQGAKRSASDPPIAGYTVRDGALVRVCRDCGEPHEDIRTCGHCPNCAETCDRCEGCASCCSCASCGRCDARVESTCSHCERCESCCECEHCSSCGDPCEYTCCHDDEEDEDAHGHSAGRCDSCCAYDTRSDSSHSVSGDGRTHPAATIMDRRTLKSPRMAGLEIEYVRCDSFRPIANYARKWGAEVHSDGSCGWEVVTSPAAGDNLLRQIADAAKALKKAEATCNDTCGLHVHVDARDLLWPDVARLVKLWHHIEPVMFLLGGDERTSNTYCEPWRDRLSVALKENAADPKGAILGVLYASGSTARAKGILKETWENGYSPEKKAGFRYRSLNLAPWVARWRVASRKAKRKGHGYTVKKKLANDSTVEFRLHEGTHDPVELQQWTILLVRIVDYVARSTDKDVANLPRSAMRALLSIAPECKAWLMSKLRAYGAIKTRSRRIGYHPRGGYTIGKSELYGEWVDVPEEFAGWQGSWAILSADQDYTARWLRNGFRTYGEAIRERDRRYVGLRVVPERREYVRNDYAVCSPAGGRESGYMRSAEIATRWARELLDGPSGGYYPDGLDVWNIDTQERIERVGRVQGCAPSPAAAPEAPEPPRAPGRLPYFEVSSIAPSPFEVPDESLPMGVSIEDARRMAPEYEALGYGRNNCNCQGCRIVRAGRRAA